VWEQADFGGAKDFCPNLPEKNPKKSPQKKSAFPFILGAFFSNQSTSSTILPKFPLTCLKKLKK